MNFKFKKILAISVLFFVSFFVKMSDGFSQDTIFPSYVEGITSINGTESLIKFKSENNFTVADFEENYASLLGLSQNDSLQFLHSETDRVGGIHYFYQQYSNGIEVEGAQVILHEKNGIARSLNGVWIKNLSVNAIPFYDENTVRRAAINAVSAEKYMWEDSVSEALIKKLRNDSTATYFPSGKLMLVSFPFSNNPQNFHLVYKFIICANKPYSEDAVYVDANGDSVIKLITLIETVDATVSASTKYNSNQDITTDGIDIYDTDIMSPTFGDYLYTEYHLRESTRNVETLNMTSAGSDYTLASEFLDDETTLSFTLSSDPVAYNAHWGSEKTYDYYDSQHSRNSYDNAGGKLWNYVHTDLISLGFSDNNNAFWSGTNHTMTYGDGDGTSFTEVVALDVVGHEITHGVEQSAMTGFDYSNPESGALSESFSDMFGIAIAKYTLGSSRDWIIGEDITPGFDGLRDMSNPQSVSVISPGADTYLGTNWVASSSDDYGSHTNCGVGNFWFYLLSEGGNGTNDNSDNYCVESIGMEVAARIAYETLTTQLTSTSNYASARSGSIAAAQSLYGVGSNQEIQVTNAWYAVGVGAEFNNPITVSPHTVSTSFNEIDKNKNTITTANAVIVPANATCIFQSGFQTGPAIFLEDGFHAANGSNFHAFIANIDCQSHSRISHNSKGHINQGNHSIITKKNIHTPVDLTYLFPNPTPGLFHLKMKDKYLEEKNIFINDFFGKQMLEMLDVKEDEMDFDLSNYPKGVYMIRIIYSDKIVTRKIVLI